MDNTERKRLQQNDGFREILCSYSNHCELLRRTDSISSRGSEGSLSVGGVDTYTIIPYASSPKTSSDVYPHAAVVKELEVEDRDRGSATKDDNKCSFFGLVASNFCIFDIIGTSMCCGGAEEVPSSRNGRR